MADKIGLEFNYRDLAKFELAMKRVEEAATKRELKRIAKTATTPMLAAVKVNTPRGETGGLRRGNKQQLWKASASMVDFEVANVAPHAHLVEFGHRQVTGGRLRTGRGRVIGSVPPHPFFRPAVDATKAIVQDRAGKEVGTFIKKAFER